MPLVKRFAPFAAASSSTSLYCILYVYRCLYSDRKLNNIDIDIVIDTYFRLIMLTVLLKKELRVDI
jgi:hypothetical protein